MDTDLHRHNKKTLDLMSTRHLAQLASEHIRFFHSRSWTPATSSNFSFKDQEEIFISRSGIEKEKFQPNDFLKISADGSAWQPEQHKPSAETKIHLWLYKKMNGVQAIYHTHSVYSTLISRNFSQVTFHNFELQKAFDDIHTHEGELHLPVFKNAQDMDELCSALEARLETPMPHAFGFLIEGHGLYTWASSLQKAKIAVEAWEFLLECFWKESVFKK